MKKNLILSIKTLLVFSLICSVVYPGGMWFLGQVFFHEQAQGSLVRNQNGTIVGSTLIAQNFSSNSYFQARPSYAGKNGYDATASSGSNLGPTSSALMQAIASRVSAYRSLNMSYAGGPVPIDAVTASASGLDPHISISNAIHQSTRIATARGLHIEEVLNVIYEHTEGRWLWLFGEKRVNVLKMNLALDQKSRS